MRTGHLLIAASLVTFAVIACGGADVGDECDAEGQADKECVDGAVCGKDKTGKLVCQTICTTDVGCQSGEVCGAIVGPSNLRGCRAR